MFSFWRRGLVAIAMAVVSATFLLAAPARAEPTESEQLSLQMAVTMIEVINFKALLASKVSSEFEANGDLDDIRPEWNDLMKQALVEELDHDMPAITQILAQAFARQFTVDELRAGSGMMNDPAFKAGMAASAAGKPYPSSAPQPSRKTVRLANSPAGQSFIRKCGEFDATLSVFEKDFAAELLPGWFRRFGEKAEAAELARRGASVAP